MKTSQVLLLTAVVAVCLLPAVFSLKCYICNSIEHGMDGCGDGKDVDSKHIKDCDSHDAHEDGQHNVQYKMCRKIVTWIDFNVNNNTAQRRIVRKCGYIDSKYNDECYYRGGFGGRQQVCSCTKDECNSGFSFRANHLLMGVGAVVVLIFGSKINNF